jgi:hypothetical protein
VSDNLKTELTAAREMVMELARRAVQERGIDSATRQWVGRAAQDLFAAELAESQVGAGVEPDHPAGRHELEWALRGQLAIARGGAVDA